MMLDKCQCPVPGHSTRIIEGEGPTVLAVIMGGVVGIFFSSLSYLLFLSPSLWETV